MVAILQYGHRFDTARPYTTVTRSLLSMSHIWHALKQVIAPGAARRYAPPRADGSSTRGGSTSARGRVRSPHMAKLQAFRQLRHARSQRAIA